MKTGDIAKLIEGVIEGDSEIDIIGISGIESAKPGDLTFAVTEDILSLAEKSRASCVLTDKSMRKSTKVLIRVENPKLSFLLIYNKMQSVEIRAGFTHPTAVVDPSSLIGKDVWIGPHVVIEEGVKIGDNGIIESNTVIKKNCTIGAKCRFYPSVTLYENCVIGNKVIINSGVRIGADGFGYVRAMGGLYKFPQLAKVIIGNDVEIGSNTAIDRGSLSDTIIGDGTKIDNLCQIAHAVKIGKNVIVAGQAGIAGSVVIKDNVTMGGQVGIADNVVIGENAKIGGQSGIIGHIRANTTVWGYPARPVAHVKRQLAVLSWVVKNFKSLQKMIK